MLKFFAGGMGVGMAGCTAQSQEPDEPPPGLSQDGVDINILLETSREILANGSYEAAGWLDGHLGEEGGSGIQVIVDRDKERCLYTFGSSMDQEAKQFGGDFENLWLKKSFHDREEGYRIGYRNNDISRSFDEFSEYIVTSLFERVKDFLLDYVEFGIPEWNDDQNLYFIPLTGSKALKEDGYTGDGELHVNADGIPVWMGGGVDDNQTQTDMELYFNVDNISLAIPDWVEDLKAATNEPDSDNPESDGGESDSSPDDGTEEEVERTHDGEWEFSTQNDAGVTSTYNPIEIWVKQCSTVTADRFLGPIQHQLRISFYWDIISEGWWERPEFAIQTDSGIVIWRGSLGKKKGDEKIFHAEPRGETTGYYANTWDIPSDEPVFIRFAIYPTDKCGSADHVKTTLRIRDIVIS